MTRFEVTWRVVDGDVLLPVDDADWLGAALSVLVAAVHHPRVLAAQQPDTDPAEAARAVLGELDKLELAGRTADRTGAKSEASTSVRLERQGDELRVAPGGEILALCFVLELFANAVLDPDGEKTRDARGAIAYSAAAWSTELGRATGALS